MPFLTRRFLGALLAVTAALLVGAVAAHAAGPRPGTGCGGSLWRLMTLSDVDRDQVDLDGLPATIAKLEALESPPSIGLRRSTDFQRRAWRMRAVVDRYRIASNGEIVLVLFNIDTGLFMDAYLPAKQCLGARARDRANMLAARRELVGRCPAATAAWQLLGATVWIEGVGFWNPSRVTRGALANGAELRPVTGLEIVSGCGVG
jgi:hypothetical protein